MFFVLLFLIFLTKKYQEITRPYMGYKNIQSLPSFFKYIDRYYIDNIYYTLFAIIMYIFFNVMILMLFRYYAIGNITFVNRSGVSFFSFLSLIFIASYFIVFIACIMLFRYLLERLFYLEILKFRLYFHIATTASNQIKRTIFHFYSLHKIVEPFGRQFFNMIACICFRISKGTFRRDFFERDFNEWYSEQVSDVEHDYQEIYENYYVANCAEFLQLVVLKFNFLSGFFYFLALIFKFISQLCRWNLSRILFDGFFVYIPYSTLFLCLIYELYNKELYYIYYLSFIYLFIHLFQRYRKFEASLMSGFDMLFIYDYFYKNDTPYKVMRGYLSKDFINLGTESEQTKSIKRSFFKDVKENEAKGIFYFILNNLEQPKESPLEEAAKKIRMTYIRAHIMLVFIIIAIFIILQPDMFIIKILNIDMPKIVLLIPLAILIISGRNAYLRIMKRKFSPDPWHDTIKDNSIYSKIFFITAIIFAYTMWAALLRPNFIFADSEVTTNISYVLGLPDEIICLLDTNIAEAINKQKFSIDLITILKIYTKEEKIMYLYQHFEYYVLLFDFTSIKSYFIDKEYLRYILRQIDFNNLIDENVMLKDIRVYIDLFLYNYVHNETFNNAFIQLLNEHIINECRIEIRRLYIQKEIMDPIIIIINSLVLFSFVIQSFPAWVFVLSKYDWGVYIIDLIFNEGRIQKRITYPKSWWLKRK